MNVDTLVMGTLGFAIGYYVMAHFYKTAKVA